MILRTTLFALWQFGSTGMLAWGLAAALPLLIHLWNRHRYREEPWAAIDFLLAAMRASARQIRFQQWLLLVVRTLILGLFAIAIAEPQWSISFSREGAIEHEPMQTILVLD